MTLDRRITLHKLDVLERVVALDSVSLAAEQLFVAQPVVTAHIRSLEERVGAKLFYREGRRLRLTEAGHTVHQWAQDVLAHTRELSRQLEGLSDGSQGSVVVMASMSIGSYMIPEVLGRFARERPQVEVRLDIINSDHAVRATEAGECDFAIVFAGHDRELEDLGLTGEQIGSENLILVAAPDGEPRSASVSLEELGRLRFIDSPREHIRVRLIDAELKKHGVDSRNIVLQMGHPEAMKRAAREGLGVVLLFSSSVTDDIASGRLRRIAISDAELAIPVYVIHRKGKTFSASQRDLLAEIRRHMAARNAGAAS